MLATNVNSVRRQAVENREAYARGVQVVQATPWSVKNVRERTTEAAEIETRGPTACSNKQVRSRVRMLPVLLTSMRKRRRRNEG